MKIPMQIEKNLDLVVKYLAQNNKDLRLVVENLAQREKDIDLVVKSLAQNTKNLLLVMKNTAQRKRGLDLVVKLQLNTAKKALCLVTKRIARMEIILILVVKLLGERWNCSVEKNGREVNERNPLQMNSSLLSSVERVWERFLSLADDDHPWRLVGLVYFTY